MKPTNREIERPFIHSTTPTDNGQRREQASERGKKREEVDGHELATAENETRGATDQGGAGERANKEQVRGSTKVKKTAQGEPTQHAGYYYIFILFLLFCYLLLCCKTKKKGTLVQQARTHRALYTT